MSRCDVALSGQENLHQFLPIILWRHALSSSIMTLWSRHTLSKSWCKISNGLLSVWYLNHFNYDTPHHYLISFRRFTEGSVLKTECYIENEGKYLLCLATASKLKWIYVYNNSIFNIFILNFQVSTVSYVSPCQQYNISFQLYISKKRNILARNKLVLANLFDINIKDIYLHSLAI